ncbi:biotin carboxyl carrier protein of acetyl-CoA carboxylase [Solanum tuberosum]|uniref:Biotin carboxyl carrier protein of acetyl-CoA carboxylase n=1 Tax=Solanum tuberosum TaxID=4113 RepID=M1C7P0_SOLTU|nr:PREDICTED: biotin carboxyl carrier protein of acetyl-CoA carboxylase [Solanum tuberosum]
MESAAVLRSFHHSVGTTSHVRSVIEMPGVIPTNSIAFSKPTKLSLKGSSNGARLMSSPNKHGRLTLSCAKTSETTVTAKSGDSNQKVPTESSPLPTATFPKGFEALIIEVCDDTEVAELKLKVGDFELHLKRNIEAPVVPAPVVSAPPPPPPSASKTSISSTAAAPAASPGKSSSGKISPFTNVAAEKSAKLAALESTGASGYVLVSCPTVGSFRRARTLKGKKQPPACKEGDIIKEGQIIGFLDQFGTELPVRSDAAGEVLKILFNDGEAVGYGDPLIAVLPSFRGIN